MAVRGAQAEIQATRNCQAADVWAWEKKKAMHVQNMSMYKRVYMHTFKGMIMSMSDKKDIIMSHSKNVSYDNPWCQRKIMVVWE